MVSPTSPSAEASSSKVSDNVDSLREGIPDESPAKQQELPVLTDEEIKKCLEDAEELKKEGTEHFRAQEWEQALAKYKSALSRLPKRPPSNSQEKEREPDTKRAEEKSNDALGSETRESESEEVVQPLTGLQLECAKARSVLNANIGACHVKLGENKEAVKACTEALTDDPAYLKALQRRAACNDQINSWSSLASAQEDYESILKLLPSNSPQVGPIRRSLASLRPRVEEAKKKETGEMLDKLKGIGNSILGNFGLSTDNFKFVPNGQGGYSINFQQ